jgi:hypothetical protein
MGSSTLRVIGRINCRQRPNSGSRPIFLTAYQLMASIFRRHLHGTAAQFVADATDRVPPVSGHRW